MAMVSGLRLRDALEERDSLRERVEALTQALREAPEPTDNVYLIGNFVSKYKTWRQAARKTGGG